MIKLSDKQSMDPVQQKLRQAKKEWNKDVSAFIDDLIHYKKLTNGQPNKFFKERSSIKEPIPADPSTILGSLAQDFQSLSQRGNAIISAQIEYSKNRKKKQTNQLGYGQELSKQLSAFDTKYNLVSDGSSFFSRFFTKLLNPGIGFGEAARIRKYRMSLLSLCAKMYKDIGKFQIEIVKSSDESISNAYDLLNNKIWHNWDLIHRGIIAYRDNVPKVVEDDGGSIKLDKNKPLEKNIENKKDNQVKVDQVKVDNSVNISNIESDYKNNYSNLEFENMNGFDSALDMALFKYHTAPPEDKELASNKVIEEYNSLISKINNLLGTNGSSMSDIFSQKIKISYSQFQLEKVSQDFLWKWLGKTRHGLSTNITSAYRLDLFKNADEIRVILNKLMDSLENGLNLMELLDLANQVHVKFTNMKGLSRSLYAQFTKSENNKSKNKSNYFGGLL